MSNLTLIIVAVVGIGLGYWLANKKKCRNIEMTEKQENKQKILDFLQKNERITNDNVEKVCGVSNATAERYLDELESEGKLTQHGETGRNVFYTLKN